MEKSLEDYTRVMRGRYTHRRGKGVRNILLNKYCSTTRTKRKYSFEAGALVRTRT